MSDKGQNGDSSMEVLRRSLPIKHHVNSLPSVAPPATPSPNRGVVPSSDAIEGQFSMPTSHYAETLQQLDELPPPAATSSPKQSTAPSGDQPKEAPLQPHRIASVDTMARIKTGR